MSTPLQHLRHTVLTHLSQDPTRPPLGGVGIFHCRAPQQLRNVPIRQPMVVLVCSGLKVIALGERRVEVRPGELLLLPADVVVEVGNHPGPAGDPYLGLALGFGADSLEQLRRQPLLDSPAEQPRLWQAPAPQPVLASLAQWVDWCLRYPVDAPLATHRQTELLMLLLRAGLAGNLLLQRQATLRERVAAQIALAPARDWCAAELARQLHLGESTLRRRLQEEDCSFREILEETRLVAGLALLQDTFWPVSQVAAAVGYQSPSRFAERFRQRFGLSPAALKRSRESAPGASSSVCGA